MAIIIPELTDNSGLSGTEQIELAVRSSSVTITATTISAAASDNSYNDSGSGFVAAGFAVNDYVVVSGFTGDTANNINSGKITALTTAKMTIGGTDGDVIVDDAAGESVTITKWEGERATAQEIADLGSGGGAAVNAQTGTAYTLVLGDANDAITMNNASANTLTIPTNASVAFPVGTVVSVVQLGAGTTTVEGDTGVTVNGTSAGSADLSAQHSAVSLLKIAADTWNLAGDHGGVS